MNDPRPGAATSRPPTPGPSPVTEFLLEHASRFGDKPALIDGPSGRAVS